MKHLQLRELRAAVAICGLLAAALAHADAVFPAPSPALQCLTPQGAALKPLVYPEDAYQRKAGGTVSVQLTFTEPDKGPDYKLLSDWHTLSGELMDAVRVHVRQFRVPCLAPGAAPVVLRQDYVFVPNDGRKVVSTKPREGDADAGTGESANGCTVDIRDSVPAYPTRMVNKDVQGVVLTQLRFDAVDRAPRVTIVAAPHQSLANSVVHAAEQLRLHCKTTAPAAQFPSIHHAIYQFRVADSSATVLRRNVALPDLIRGSQTFPTGVYFDTRTMGCPFDVRLTYYQPHWSNRVGQLESANPARQPLLDWLGQIQLRLRGAERAEVLGDSMDVHVPCTVIDL